MNDNKPEIGIGFALAMARQSCVVNDESNMFSDFRGEHLAEREPDFPVFDKSRKTMKSRGR